MRQRSRVFKGEERGRGSGIAVAIDAACSFELPSLAGHTTWRVATRVQFGSVLRAARSRLCNNKHLPTYTTYCDDNVQATTPVPTVTCRFAQTTIILPGSHSRALARRGCTICEPRAVGYQRPVLSLARVICSCGVVRTHLAHVIAIKFTDHRRLREPESCNANFVLAKDGLK